MKRPGPSGGLIGAGLAAAIALAVAAAAVFSPAPQAYALQAFGRVKIGEAPPGFTLTGSDRRRHRLSDYAGKVVILEWTSPACQFTAAKYTSGQMQALQRRAAADGAVWLSINTTGARSRAGYLTPAAAARRVRDTRAQVTAF